MIYNCIMTDYFSGLLTKNNETFESRELFYSFQSSDKEFDSCFLDLFEFDYNFVFGKQPKKKFLYSILKKYYRNDFFVRYSFIKAVLSKSKAISFEEFPVSNSRADLVSINGKSIAYEIKSEYDNYDRLEKQIYDYSKCFEYVYVICPKTKVKQIGIHLPDFCGIYAYDGKNKIRFELIKQANLSPNLSLKCMISSLRKSELLEGFSTDDYNKIIEKFSLEKINNIFKKALKERFKNVWQSLKIDAESLK